MTKENLDLTIQEMNQFAELSGEGERWSQLAGRDLRLAFFGIAMEFNVGEGKRLTEDEAAKARTYLRKLLDQKSV